MKENRELSKWSCSVFPDRGEVLAKNEKFKLSVSCESEILLHGAKYEAGDRKRKHIN